MFQFARPDPFVYCYNKICLYPPRTHSVAQQKSPDDFDDNLKETQKLQVANETA
jgi:hypothetical protein